MARPKRLVPKVRINLLLDPASRSEAPIVEALNRVMAENMLDPTDQASLRFAVCLLIRQRLSGQFVPDAPGEHRDAPGDHRDLHVELPKYSIPQAELTAPVAPAAPQAPTQSARELAPAPRRLVIEDVPGFDVQELPNPAQPPASTTLSQPAQQPASTPVQSSRTAPPASPAKTSSWAEELANGAVRVPASRGIMGLGVMDDDD